jgi:hypothetical protein
MIISVTLVEPITSIEVKTYDNSVELKPIDEKHRLHKILDRLIDEVINNSDPYDELQELLSCYDLRQTIITISGNDTLYAIDCFFSQRTNIFKLLNVNKYSNSIIEKKQDFNLDILENKIFELINNPPESIDYLYNVTEINLSSDEINKLYFQMENYFNENFSLSIILKDSQLDCLLIFIVAMIIWGFCYSATAIYFPDIFSIILCYSEALILGISCSALLAQIYIIKNLSSWIVETIPFISLYINTEALEAVISSLICVIILGVYIFLFESSMIIKLIASGAGFLAPPLILFILCLVPLNENIV